MEVSCSSTLVLVDLYAPVILSKHFLCIDFRGLTILSGVFPRDKYYYYYYYYFTSAGHVLSTAPTIPYWDTGRRGVNLGLHKLTKLTRLGRVNIAATSEI